jgi:hypothetical protein
VYASGLNYWDVQERMKERWADSMYDVKTVGEGYAYLLAWDRLDYLLGW